jgi:hypothetical protein
MLHCLEFFYILQYFFLFLIAYLFLDLIMSSSLKRKDSKTEHDVPSAPHMKSVTIHASQEEAFSKLVLTPEFHLEHRCCNNTDHLIGGNFCWKFNVGDSPVSHKFISQLERQFNTPLVVLNECQVKVQPLLKTSAAVKKNSRYNLMASMEDEQSDDVDERQFFFMSITKFNTAVDYIMDKVVNPISYPKHSNVDAGIIDPIAWTRLNPVASLDIMFPFGQHMCSFTRYGKTPNSYKYSKRSLDSVRKAFLMLLDIAEMFYSENTKSFIEYVGDADANEPVFKRNVFTLHFDEGFFAEGKTGRLSKLKHSIIESPLFIRGEPVFAQGKSTLEIHESIEERLLISQFINNAGSIMTALKIFNLVRTNKIDNDIFIDRGVFSRIYFQYYQDIIAPGTPSVKSIFNGFYAPLALYYDMIQANFYTPVKVNFIHNFWMNSLRRCELSWRNDTIREYERNLYPTQAEEILKRKEVYRLIYFHLPALINLFTNEEMSQEFNSENTVVDFTMVFKQQHMQQEQDVFLMKCDFFPQSRFETFIHQFYNTNTVL